MDLPIATKKGRKGKRRLRDKDTSSPLREKKRRLEERRPSSQYRPITKRRPPGKSQPGLRATTTVIGTRTQDPRNCFGNDFESYSGSPPGPRWFTYAGKFQVPSSESSYWSNEEAKERRRCARIDFAQRNFSYIVELCEAARGGLWKCRIDENNKILVGCRNYIIQLVFEDGVRWLLKTSQPPLEWSSYYDLPGILNLEIATTLWLRQNTSIPVPRVRLWDIRTNKENKFGKPWYVMDKIPGGTVEDQVQSASSRDPKFVWEKQQVKQYKHLAKFELEFIRYPSPSEGELILNSKASYFHGGQRLPSDQVEISENEKDEICGLTDSMIELLDLNSDKLQTEAGRRRIDQTELDANEALFDYLDEAIQKIIDPRFEDTYCLIHGDITEANILCDREFYITAVIDWELARVVPLQLAVAQPGTNGKQFLSEVQELVKNATTGKKVNISEVSKRWKAYDTSMQYQRDRFVEEISKLDDSVMGDGKSPWTAGYKYVTGLYRLSHAVQTIWYFLSEYEKFLDLDKYSRMFILAEIRKLAEGAVKLVSEGILSREGGDEFLDELNDQV
ncbi:hypothetical protein Dda_9138 [Drechslerella dactyloides]|uniref:Aminoglycoside phosphotransferase domain-containing protein n=1 Tax=Drechslerella dactyloides TaxID=74499 RepID=A0AAD6NEK8_DREDA|nr:hypothetical protein Dda_9138 [Drechslerella dactyloides]